MPMSAEAFAKLDVARGEVGTPEGGQFIKKGSGYDKSDQKERARVRLLQRALISLGLLSTDSGANGGVDGKFGKFTNAALRKWQKQNGVKVTGRVGPSDIAKIVADARKKRSRAAKNKSGDKNKSAPSKRKPAMRNRREDERKLALRNKMKPKPRNRRGSRNIAV